MNGFLKTLANAVFPRFCVRCQREGSLLCADCFSVWQPAAMSMSTLPEGHLASLNYADPVARQLICAWKYKYDQTAWEIIQKVLAPRLATLKHLGEARRLQAIVPLPLHKTRLCERGFDQAEEIARFISMQIGLPFVPMLERVRATGKQAEREEGERISAMRQSPFVFCYPTSNFQHLTSILLVDDVWTTGATARAGAQVLRAAGAREVLVYTLAKGK